MATGWMMTLNWPTRQIPMTPMTTTSSTAAWWPTTRIDGNADDQSGNGNDGTVNGATLAPDRNGDTESAYSFDGTDDRIEIADSPELNFAESMSILALVKARLLGRTSR